MARYLAYTSPARGHLYPIVPTLLELRRRGHDVHVRTIASEIGVLRELGLQAQPIAPAIEDTPLTDWEAATPEEGLAGVWDTFNRRALAELPDFRQAVADVAPDALIVDVTTPAAAALAEACGLPWAQTIPLFQHSAAPFASHGGVFPVPFGLTADGIEVLNRPRRELGLPEIAGPDDAWRASLHLYYTAPPFESRAREFPPSFRLVGPSVWDPPATAPEWLEEPVVLVTVSSEFQRDAALIEAAIAGLGGEPMQVAITTAAHDPAAFEAPHNVRLERWLPHGPVIERASCVVCHGGMGITQKALAAGVPVCVVPFGRDQFDVGGHVMAAGAGTMVMPDALSPEALCAAVREAIGLRDGAQRVAEGFRQAGGAAAAADELEELLARVAATAGAG